MTEAAGPNGLKGCHGTHFLLTAVWARVAMALFGLWADLHPLPDVNAITLHFAVTDEVWMTLAMIFVCWPPSRNQATQIGLGWRLARRVYRSGLTETEFQVVDPWQEPAAQDPGR